MAYHKTEPLLPIGSYYEETAVLPVGQIDVTSRDASGACPKGYHPGKLSAGGVSVDAPVCVKKSYNAMHIGLAGLVGLIVGKML